jgi:hypothetical protein
MLVEQFKMPPLARLAQLQEYVAGEHEIMRGLGDIFGMADEFNGRLASEEFRDEVKKVASHEDFTRVEAFRKTRSLADDLQRALECVFFDSKLLGPISRKYLSF